MRVKPSPTVAVALFFAYLIVTTGISLAFGVDAENPEALVETTGDVLRLLASTGIAAVLVAAVVTWFGWWRPVLVEPRRLPRWYLALPVLYAIAILVAIKYESLGEHGAGKLLLIGLAVLLVGFNSATVSSRPARRCSRGRPTTSSGAPPARWSPPSCCTPRSISPG